MFPVLLASLMIAAGPTELKVSAETLPFEVEAWKKETQVRLTVVEMGKETVYTGVPLYRVIQAQLPGKKGMAELRALSDAVILISASDGYQAVVSAAAVAMDPKGERYLLAFGRDGKPLEGNHAPARLVVPGDPQRVRWVRAIRSIQLVRLGTPKAP